MRKALEDLHPRYAKDREKAIERSLRWVRDNPERARRTRRLYAIKHKKKLAQRRRKYVARPEIKQRALAAQQAFYRRNPWYRSWQAAKSRCNCTSDTGYRYYGARGIQFLLSKVDMVYLWQRDQAGFMEQPTLDRINSLGHYELSNCRFMERRLNCMKGASWDRMARQSKQFIALFDQPPLEPISL